MTTSGIKKPLKYCKVSYVFIEDISSTLLTKERQRKVDKKKLWSGIRMFQQTKV